MWAGIECTVNRVGNRYFDQCVRNGHDLRSSDFELFKNLGIKRLRYPVLWEKTVRGLNPRARDWQASDRALRKFQRLKLPLIVGLLHHGSGPRFTSLTDPNFPELFADYARTVIERYPHLDSFTPINEPLTTARFSGLYGIWYPHAKDDRTFLRALLNEVKGTIRAMQAIRWVRPTAQLIWTEDFGRAQGTRLLQYQVDFENERRFLSLDLLMGYVDSRHPLYSYVTQVAKVPVSELEWLRANAIKPDMIGINHYPLSNRYLDENLDRFPTHLHGGNGRHRYADVGAVDTDRCSQLEPADIYRDVWERFQVPCAVTEAHIAGSREAQLRWLSRVWEGCRRLRSEGCDVRAVTAWSLLGSYDWNSLCSVENGFYESGVFDLRSGHPRPTSLSRMVSTLANDGTYEHPLFEDAPIALLTSNLEIEKAFRKICAERQLNLLPMEDMNAKDLDERIREFRPWAIIVDATHADKISSFTRAHGIQLQTFPPKNHEATKSDRNSIVLDQTSNLSELIHFCLNQLIDGDVGKPDANENSMRKRSVPTHLQPAKEFQ